MADLAGTGPAMIVALGTIAGGLAILGPGASSVRFGCLIMREAPAGTKVLGVVALTGG